MDSYQTKTLTEEIKAKLSLFKTLYVDTDTIRIYILLYFRIERHKNI